MIAASVTLPQGRQGKALAIAISLLALALIWFAAIAPLVGWYEAQAALLTQQRTMAARMQVLAQEIPQLRAAVSAAGPQSAGEQMLLAGGTDAIAGANLQLALQNLAVQAGTSLDSDEMMPAQQIGALREIGMQVSITATWPVLVALLEAVGTARPRMIVSALSIASPTPQPGGQPGPMQASFSVSGFRAGSP